MDRWNVAAKVAAASSAVLALGLLLTGFFAWRAADRKVLGLQLQQASANLLRTGGRDSDGRQASLWAANTAFDLGWELDFWGKF